MSEINTYFTQSILEWYDPLDRPLPWKGEKNPYRIWLSEIILQQTKVVQGQPYYLKFIEKFPTIHDLAHADDDDVMKTWEGLGYYSRARNMLKTARWISNENQGEFPSTYHGLLELSGIGPYTAAAIASFAYGLPHAVLDGNVYRILSRFFGIQVPTNTAKGKTMFANLTQELLPLHKPALYNQAIMDLGATVCTPKSPDCQSCPLQVHCKAFQQNEIKKYPVKQPKPPRRIRYFHFIVINNHHEVFIQKRETKDIWQNLYSFPIIESDQFHSKENLFSNHNNTLFDLNKEDLSIHAISPPSKQLLTHQDIRAVFVEIKLNKRSVTKANHGIWVPRPKLNNYAFPKIVDWYLHDNTLYLDM